MYSKAMILQLWYRFLDLDSSHRCWLLAAAGCAEKGVPPVMHDLIIFRALFSDSIPLRFY